MKLYDNKDYMEDVYRVGQLDLPWEKLKDKSIMLSGATGLLGSFLIDVLMEKNNAPRLLKIGIQDKYSIVGDYGFLKEQHGLTPEYIAKIIIDSFGTCQNSIRYIVVDRTDKIDHLIEPGVIREISNNQLITAITI